MRNISLKTLLKTASVIFILLFVLTTILSANIFITSNRNASRSYLLDRAVTETCTIAETLKSTDGNLTETSHLLTNHKSSKIEENILTLYYDEMLNPCIEKRAYYTATVTCEEYNIHNSYSIILNSIDNKTTLYSISFKYIRGGNYE